MARTNAREDPLHAQAQLCRQLQQLATHFPLQQQKYAKEHTTDSLRRVSVLRFQAELSHPLRAASEKTPPLKTQHFSRGLFTNGLHVRIQIGEPLCFYEHHRPGECCESAKRM
jgi:hypothetical protein